MQTAFLPWLSPSNTANPNESAESSASADKRTNTEDYVYNYACSLLFFGMLVKYYEDAIKEGDANREEKFWKIAMLIFKAKINNQTNRVKYAFESFKYLAMIKAVLPPQLSMKLKWGRFVNQKGGSNKMECDRRLKTEVRSNKDKQDGMGKNLTPASAQRIARSSNSINSMLENFDTTCQVVPQVLSHSTVSRDLDLHVMVNDLLRQDVFEFVPGRKHSAFPAHNRSPVHNLHSTTLLKWMKTLRRKFAKGNLSFLMDGSEENGNEEEGNEDTRHEK